MPRGVRLDPAVRAARIAEIENQRETRRLIREQKKAEKKKFKGKASLVANAEKLAPAVIGLHGLDESGKFASRIRQLENVTLVHGALDEVIAANPLVIMCADSGDVLEIDKDPNAAGLIVAFASAKPDDWEKVDMCKNVWPIMFGVIPDQGLVLGGTRTHSGLIAHHMRAIFDRPEVTKTKLHSMMIAQQARKEQDPEAFCRQFNKAGEEALELLGNQS